MKHVSIQDVQELVAEARLTMPKRAEMLVALLFVS
jgi:hypothetical protein